MMQKVIEAINLKKYYHRGSEIVKALDGVDFEIFTGEMVAIVGPSGSGKTTLMNLVSCLDTPTSGNLKITNKDVTGFAESELINIRQENIGFIFQQFYLIPTLTVKENILLPLTFSHKKIDDVKLNELMVKIGLKGKEHLQTDEINGGDKQKIAIARAIVNEPQILIADEPTGRLETTVRDTIVDLFKELKQSNLAVFIATHDLELADKCDRIIYLQDGKIVKREESNLYS